LVLANVHQEAELVLPTALFCGDIPYFVQEADGRRHAEPQRFAALVCGSFNPLHEGHLGLLAAAARRVVGPVACELSIGNVDKPTLTEHEVEARLAQFENVAPIIVTHAPMFVAKSRLFPGTLFAIGLDTAERVADPKYYGDIAAELAAVRAAGCRFLVAGRIDSQGQFRNLADLAIAPAIADLFESLSEAEFRTDVSSTALRAARREV